jgi:uncharacterized protein (TIGR03067 family)
MTRLVLVPVALLVVSGLAMSQDDPKKVVESLQGEWKIASFNKGGELVPQNELAGSKIVVAGEKMTITFNKKDEPAAFKVAPKADPPAIDIIPAKNEKNMVVKGIYKLEKDKLTICFGPDGADRPAEFKASKKASVMVLERVKP